MNFFGIFGDVVYGFGIATITLAGIAHFFSFDSFLVLVIGCFAITVGSIARNLQGEANAK